MSSPSRSTMLAYEPQSHELAFYEELFVMADLSKVGQIQGRDAVSFLSRSKLPMETLKNIWTIADNNPTTNSLDRRKFFVAVRLIQLYQNGKSAVGPNLGVVADGTIMRLPYFEGITGFSPPSLPSDASNTSLVHGSVATQGPAVIPMAGPPTGVNILPEQQPIHQPITIGQPSHPGTMSPMPSSYNVLATVDPYTMNPGDLGRYEMLFPQYEKEGFVYGKEAVELFSKSGLDNDILRDIWNMVDEPADNRLSKLEFCMAMHLIVCVSKKNLPPPRSLPRSLEALKKADTSSNINGTTGTITTHHVKEMSASSVASGVTPVTPIRQTTYLPPPVVAGGLSVSEAFDDLSPRPNPMYMQQYQQQVLNPAHPSGSPLRNITEGDIAASNRSLMSQLPPEGIYGPLKVPTLSVTVGPNDGIPPSADSLNHHNFSIQPATNPAVENTSSSALTPLTTVIGALNISMPPNTGGHSVVIDEIMKLRSILQNLQAENVSLKSQLNQFTDEEKQVRGEITETSADIVTLLHDLSILRNRVAEARVKLMEATSELKALTEKRNSLKDLLSQEEATEKSIYAAIGDIHQSRDSLSTKTYNSASHNVSSVPAPSVPPPPPVSVNPPNFFDYDLIGVMEQPKQQQIATEQPLPNQTSSGVIVYPMPDIPEYNPGMVMGGTTGSLSRTRFGTGTSVDGRSVDFSHTSAYEVDAQNHIYNHFENHPSTQSGLSYTSSTWNHDAAHSTSGTPPIIETPFENHHNDTGVHSNEANSVKNDETSLSHEKPKKWGKFLRRSSHK